jgi:hypothetical protein
MHIKAKYAVPVTGSSSWGDSMCMKSPIYLTTWPELVRSMSRAMTVVDLESLRKQQENDAGHHLDHSVNARCKRVGGATL